MKKNILLMKHRWIYFLLGGLMTFYACSSNDEPELPKGEPEPTEPTFNKSDSLALIEIYKQGDGENWSSTWDFNDIMTWGGTGWAIVENEYRCVQLFMISDNTGNGIISPKIGELEYLVKFDVAGAAFGGEMPETITKLKHLKYFVIRNTLITKIPDDIFNENLIYVYIVGNDKLGGTLPSSLTKLKGGSNSNPKRTYTIMSNAYTGAIPLMKDVEINLSGNNLTSYPMEMAGIREDGKQNIWATHNKLSGTIPEEVLKDTLRIIYFSGQVNLQQEGYGYSNMPTNDELTNMFKIYKNNHPEIN